MQIVFAGSRKALPSLLCESCKYLMHCRKPPAIGSEKKCPHCKRVSSVRALERQLSKGRNGSFSKG